MNAREPLTSLPAGHTRALGAFADSRWDEAIVPALTDYIAVPAKSPMFDAEWASHGHIDRVVRDAAGWVERQKLPGLKLEVIRLEGRTPLIFFDVPATRPGPKAGWRRRRWAARSSSAPTSVAATLAA